MEGYPIKPEADRVEGYQSDIQVVYCIPWLTKGNIYKMAHATMYMEVRR